MTTRVMPPGTTGNTPTTTNINKLTYQASPGSVLDVPDNDAVALATQGWLILGATGLGTVSRAAAPVVVPTAQTFLDGATGAKSYFDGKTWRDHNGKAL